MSLKLVIKLLALFLSIPMWATTAEAAFNKVLCEVDKYSVRVVGDVPDGEIKYIVFNYLSEKTTQAMGRYQRDSRFHNYIFILHGAPSYSIVEVAASRENDSIVFLRVWEYGTQIYNKKCTFGKRFVGEIHRPK